MIMSHTSDQAPNATSLHLKEEFSWRAFQASKLSLGFVEFFAPVKGKSSASNSIQCKCSSIVAFVEWRNIASKISLLD